jgi:hypothetical protein
MSKPKTKEVRFSDHFKLGKSQPGLDFVDIPVNGDIRLFVDPYAFTLENDPWFIDTNNLIIDYFSLLIELIRAGDLDHASRLLANLHEPRETHLGFSAVGSSGRGIGTYQATDLLDALRNSQAVQTGKLKDLADCELLIPGISADKISDITTNIIRGQLIGYTEAQCALHNIQTTRVAGGVFWDSVRRNWVNRYANLPLFNNEKIILVPKAAVRFRPEITADEFYNHYVLDFLEAEHLRANDALVETLKNGRRVVRRKDLRRKYPLTKDFLFEFTQAHPELLNAYKADVQDRSRPLNDQELEWPHQDVREINYEQLASDLDEIPTGAQHATNFHNFIFGALEAIFYPALRYPQKEEEIHEGRKRIDITFNNGDRLGFFAELNSKYGVFCPFIFFECKNYSSDPANPELDQLSGRFSDKRGMFGGLVCRRVTDKALMLRRCKDMLFGKHEVILVFDDDDIKTLLKMRSEGNLAGINRFMHEQMRRLAM